MLKTIRNAFISTFGYVIIGHGCKKRHYAMRYSEACQWAACYDRLHGASIFVAGRCIAMKGKSTKPLQLTGF